MREQIMQRMEGADSLSRQFGLTQFDDNNELWWPKSMRVEPKIIRNNRYYKIDRKINGGQRAAQI